MSIPQYLIDQMEELKADPDPDVKLAIDLLLRNCSCGGIKILGISYGEHMYLCSDCNNLTKE